MLIRTAIYPSGFRRRFASLSSGSAVNMTERKCLVAIFSFTPHLGGYRNHWSRSHMAWLDHNWAGLTGLGLERTNWESRVIKQIWFTATTCKMAEAKDYIFLIWCSILIWLVLSALCNGINIFSSNNGGGSETRVQCPLFRHSNTSLQT